MVTEVYPDIFKVDIPLPNNPLRAINSYIILSEDQNLIIDTGFNTEECKNVLTEGIKELNLDLSKTYLLVTHLHSDHSGLAAYLNDMGVSVYSGAIDGELINEMSQKSYWDRFEEFAKLFDLKKDNVCFEDNPGYKYRNKEKINFTYLKEGEKINIGKYSFQVIDIPGHTPGHIGLYEKEHKIFFGGDHILDKITPNITFWGFDKNILSVYFQSLKKVYNYEIEYLFTAHRSIVKDHRKRIDELLDHHQKRLEEIMNIIKDGKISVRDTASKMKWDLKCNGWEDFPNAQKWFAAGEAMSHLEHIVNIGKGEKFLEKGILLYRLKNN